MVRQMMRVGAASAVALCVDVSVYLSLLHRFELAAPAALLGHVSGILVHFAVSSLFLLRDEMAYVRGAAGTARALAKFFVAGGCGMLVTTCVIYLSVDLFGLHPLAGKGIAVVLSFLAVFIALKLLVLRNHAPAAPHGGVVGGGSATLLNSEA